MNASIYYHVSSECNGLPILFLPNKSKHSSWEHLSTFETNYLHAQQFKGNPGDVVLMPDAKGNTCKVFIGQNNISTAHAINHAVTKLPPSTYYCQAPLSKYAQLNWSLAQYQFTNYKSELSPPRRLIIDPSNAPSLLSEANAVYLVRDLINRPANDLTPKALSEILVKLAKEHNATFQQWVGDELLSAGFPAIYTVGRAASSTPRLLELNWGESHHPRITLVGKGVCFDTGGLSLKPSNAMRLMKKDMGGAAHVIGLAQWLMSERLPIRLQVLIPAVENAIGAFAYRPGDVITMRNGLTVEIDNTDAEGRLILADALVKACEDSPELLFNFATLTGAARVAVGTEIAAMFTESDVLANELSVVANECGDPIWRLPLHKNYTALLDSTIASLANAGPSPYAGAITAALFLQHFIASSITWAHFDIMAWNVSNEPGKPEGGEAMGMRTVAHYLLQKYR